MGTSTITKEDKIRQVVEECQTLFDQNKENAWVSESNFEALIENLLCQNFRTPSL